MLKLRKYVIKLQKIAIQIQRLPFRVGTIVINRSIIYTTLIVERSWFILDFIKNVLGEALQPRNEAYMKIIKLDFNTDAYEPIRVPDNEWDNMGLGENKKVSTWFKELAKSPIIHDADKEKFKVFADYDKIKECFLRGEKYPTFVHRRIKGNEYVLAVSVLEPSENYTPDNQEVFLYVVDIDHIYFRAYADIIQRLGEKDCKTGTYSRHAFDMELIKVSRQGNPIGVVYADVNGLKYINSNYGRQAGDKVVSTFADWLIKTFPAPMYKCYRVCGEEFVVIMEGMVDSKSFDQKIKEAKDFMWQHKPLACLGHAVGNGIEVGLLLDKAEAEMYKEKRIFYTMFPKLR